MLCMMYFKFDADKVARARCDVCTFGYMRVLSCLSFIWVLYLGPQLSLLSTAHQETEINVSMFACQMLLYR